MGVAPQYSGTLGKVANCQVVVSAEYVEDAPETSTPLHWPVSARLFLPEAWAARPGARAERAHVPRDVAPPDQAGAGRWRWSTARGPGACPSPSSWPTRATARRPAFLAGLEARRGALRLRRQAPLRPAPARRGRRPRPRRPRRRTRDGDARALPRPAPLWDAETLLACLPEEAWETVTWREGTKGALAKQFVAVRVHRATGNPEVGTNGRSVAHGRVTTGPAGLAAGRAAAAGRTRASAKQYFLWLPGWPLETPLARLVTLAHARWAIEQAYEDAKGECGLDDYQGRRWDGLHRHLALTWLAYTFLVLQRLAARAPLDEPDAPAAPGFPPSAAAPTDRAPPRRPSLPAVHRQVLLWLLHDLVRWYIATDQLHAFRPRRN